MEEKRVSVVSAVQWVVPELPGLTCHFASPSQPAVAAAVMVVPFWKVPLGSDQVTVHAAAVVVLAVEVLVEVLVLEVAVVLVMVVELVVVELAVDVLEVVVV
ncbi:MAG: hypothetical protein KGI26_06020 [Thaumarchaeota archaeon]|nr:hypothetical protein [Nitrososphaerota archaeon]